ncbi:hypothetical protein [Thalassobacillus hwangdonensis]|uniref:IDEAL domain-containing protein n=1 Tax=Thalassobacillus hwangdonensis TaxID=546108 RepID=A0ABW3L064_9BACI
MENLYAYTDYFPRKRIAIGEKDRLSLTRKKFLGDEKGIEYWLVVMKGLDKGDSCITWKVTLLTSQAEGIYDLKSIPVKETNHLSFQEALDTVREWEEKLLNDRWFETNHETESIV